MFSISSAILSYPGRTLNECVNCFIFPYSVPTDHMGMAEVSSQCLKKKFKKNNLKKKIKKYIYISRSSFTKIFSKNKNIFEKSY